MLWMFGILIDLFAAVALTIAWTARARLGDADYLRIGLLCGAGAIVTVWGLLRRAATDRGKAAAYAEAMAWPDRQPFLVTGYASWLACDRPLFELRLRAAFDRPAFERGLRAIDPDIEIEPIDDRTSRIAIPAAVGTRGRAGSVRYGNAPLLHRVFAELVVPLHAEVGVERASLGGLVEPEAIRAERS